MKAKDYIIAGMRVRLTEPYFTFRGLSAFEAEILEDSAPTGAGYGTPESVPVIEVRHTSEIAPGADFRPFDTFDFRDMEAECTLSRGTEGFLFLMQPRSSGKRIFFRMNERSGLVATNYAPEDPKALFRFGLWMVFNLAAAARGIAAVHASAIRYDGAAVLFLGKSGTGKSTHTRLWREHIPGTSLLNDDSPLVTVSNGKAIVFGSPWSGKTPCYRNERNPIRAIVRLTQGQVNRIQRLSVIQGYAALQPSLPPSFMHDERLSDSINALISELLSTTPIYSLECRPDTEAARTACEAIYDK